MIYVDNIYYSKKRLYLFCKLLKIDIHNARTPDTGDQELSLLQQNITIV